MKQVAAELLEVIQAHASTLATCWKVERTDGVVLGFTSHQKDIELDGVVYTARTGYTPTSVVGNSILSVDNLDLEGILSNGGITDEDVRAGVYDYSKVTIFQIDYLNPGFGINIIRKGIMGEFTLRDGIYITELRGLLQMLARVFIRVVTPDCNAELYDDRCTVDPSAFINSGTIASVITPRSVFSVTLGGTPRSIGYFTDALITFSSGLASGRSFEIDSHTSGDVLKLYLKSPWNLEVGDTFLIQRGCDREFETCKAVFDNVVNFRGFHKVPGQDAVLKTPDAKS